LDIATNAGITSFNFSTIALVNEGVITKTADTGITSLDARLTNTGTITAAAGTVRLARGGTSAGVLNAADGAVIEFTGTQAFTLAAGSVVTGAGTVGVLDVGASGVGPTVTVAGAWSPAATVVDASFSIGTPTLNVDAADATTGTLSHARGTIGGSGTLTVRGDYTWSGGNLGGDGLTVVQGHLSIEGTATRDFTGDRTLRVAGTGTWSSTGLMRPGGNVNRGTLHIADTGTIDITADVNTGNFNNFTVALHNEGTLTKSAGSATASLDMRLTNTGTISVESGTLRFARTTTTSGLVRVAADTTLRVSTNDYVQTAGATILESPTATFVLDAGRTLALQFGLLAGTGMVDGPVVNAGGTVAPGLSTGTLTITGNYTQGADATLHIEIGGLTAGSQFDQLVVSGTAALRERSRSI
jgi:hypothetical protein